MNTFRKIVVSAFMTLLGLFLFAFLAFIIVSGSAPRDASGTAQLTSAQSFLIFAVAVVLTALVIFLYWKFEAKKENRWRYVSDCLDGRYRFRAPMSKELQRSLANDAIVEANLYTTLANNAEDLDSFFECYDKLIECCKMLIRLKKVPLTQDPKIQLNDIETGLQKYIVKVLGCQKESVIRSIEKTGPYDISLQNHYYKSFADQIDNWCSRFSPATVRYAEKCLEEVRLKLGLRSSGESSEVNRGCSDPLSQVDRMDGLAFEHWCAEVLRRNGFVDVQVTVASGDQGVDILAEKGGVRYAIQCKCYSSDLGNGPVQEVNAGKAIYHCHIGVVMTNRYFTKGAKEAAEATGVLLWDRKWLKEHVEQTS